MMTPDKELELFRRYISASMEEGDRETLKGLLKNDHRASERFTEFLEDTATFVSVAEELSVENCAQKIEEAKNKSAARKSPLKKMRTSKNRAAFRAFAAVAATLTVSCVLLFKYLKESKSAALANAAEVSLQRGGFDFTWGDKSILLSGDSVTALKDTTINLKDGSKLNLRKGAVCKVDFSDEGFVIDQNTGRIGYEVAKQLNEHKFKVMTAKMRTTVIGTQFTVDALADGTKVRVTEGKVKVDDLVSKSYYVEPWQVAEISGDGELQKKDALVSMKLKGLLKDSRGNKFDAEALEGKKYFLLYFASQWDPVSRVSVHSLKKKYRDLNGDTELIFVNDKDGFASEYEMPWISIDESMQESALKVLGTSVGTNPLNLILIDQKGTVLSQAHDGQQWLGFKKVLTDLDTFRQRNL